VVRDSFLRSWFRGFSFLFLFFFFQSHAACGVMGIKSEHFLEFVKVSIFRSLCLRDGFLQKFYWSLKIQELQRLGHTNKE